MALTASPTAAPKAPLSTRSSTAAKTGVVHRLFLEHPDEVNETYLEHFRTASSFAGGLALCALCCFVHALVPALFTKSASQRVERMHARMHNRGAPQQS